MLCKQQTVHSHPTYALAQHVTPFLFATQKLHVEFYSTLVHRPRCQSDRARVRPPRRGKRAGCGTCRARGSAGRGDGAGAIHSSRHRKRVRARCQRRSGTCRAGPRRAMAAARTRRICKIAAHLRAPRNGQFTDASRSRPPDVNKSDAFPTARRALLGRGTAQHAAHGRRTENRATPWARGGHVSAHTGRSYALLGVGRWLRRARRARKRHAAAKTLYILRESK